MALRLRLSQQPSVRGYDERPRRPRHAVRPKHIPCASQRRPRASRRRQRRPGRPRRALHRHTRLTVARRQEWRCVGEGCKGEVLLPAEFEIHHLHAHSLGGSDLLTNLQALCPSCHAIHTRREFAWILLSNSLCAVDPTARLCIQCKVVTSTTWPHSRCSGWVEPEGIYESILEQLRLLESGRGL